MSLSAGWAKPLILSKSAFICNGGTVQGKLYFMFHPILLIPSSCNAPINVMPHLPPTGHRWGLDQSHGLIPIPQGMLSGLMPHHCPWSRV